MPVTNDISECYIDMMGRKVSLDRLFAPPRDDAEYLKPIVYNCFVPILADHTLYSINLNIPDSDPKLYEDKLTCVKGLTGKIEEKKETILISVKRQRKLMLKYIDKFFSTFMCTMRKLARFNSSIYSYAIAFEKTQKGIIHAHGILAMNNNYFTAVSQHMAMAWIKASGAKACAQHKTNAKGMHNNAFDKCNNFDSWMNYMLKECNSEILDMYYEHHVNEWNKEDNYDYHMLNFPVNNSDDLDYKLVSDYEYERARKRFLEITI